MLATDNIWTYFDICRESRTYGHILTYVDSSVDSTRLGYGVSNFYKKKTRTNVQQTLSKPRILITPTVIYYNTVNNRNALPAKSEALMSLSYKSCTSTSPSVVSKSFTHRTKFLSAHGNVTPGGHAGFCALRWLEEGCIIIFIGNKNAGSCSVTWAISQISLVCGSSRYTHHLPCHIHEHEAIYIM